MRGSPSSASATSARRASSSASWPLSASPASPARPRTGLQHARVDLLILALDQAVGNERSYNARRRVPTLIRRALTVPLERPALEPVLRARLEQLYAPDTARLRAHTGLRFESWSV